MKVCNAGVMGENPHPSSEPWLVVPYSREHAWYVLSSGVIVLFCGWLILLASLRASPASFWEALGVVGTLAVWTYGLWLLVQGTAGMLHWGHVMTASAEGITVWCPLPGPRGRIPWCLVRSVIVIRPYLVVVVTDVEEALKEIEPETERYGTRRFNALLKVDGGLYVRRSFIAMDPDDVAVELRALVARAHD
jgi:hypothetical protein